MLTITCESLHEVNGRVDLLQRKVPSLHDSKAEILLKHHGWNMTPQTVSCQVAQGYCGA